MARPKGSPKLGGRQKGTPNKMTAAVKDMIITALDKAGGVDYLVRQASENPGPFMTLVGKVLPLQVTGENGEAIKTEARLALDVSSMTEEQLRALASIPVRRG